MHNAADLDLLMMQTVGTARRLRNVSTLNRKAIVERAAQLNVNVIDRACTPGGGCGSAACLAVFLEVFV